MLRLSIEELSALNIVLSICSVQELLEAAMFGFTDTKENPSVEDKEKSDICWKVLKTLR